MADHVTVREAAEADGPMLAEIERRTPLQLGDVAIVIDRRDDYFAAARPELVAYFQGRGYRVNTGAEPAPPSLREADFLPADFLPTDFLTPA